LRFFSGEGDSLWLRTRRPRQGTKHSRIRVEAGRIPEADRSLVAAHNPAADSRNRAILPVAAVSPAVVRSQVADSSNLVVVRSPAVVLENQEGDNNPW